jgi:hypothetical protein
MIQYNTWPLPGRRRPPTGPTVGEERRGGRDSRGVAQNGLDHLGASVVETYYAHTQAR